MTNSKRNPFAVLPGMAGAVIINPNRLSLADKLDGLFPPHISDDDKMALIIASLWGMWTRNRPDSFESKQQLYNLITKVIEQV